MIRARKDIIKTLRERGERLTPVRSLIIHTLCDKRSPLSAKEILKTLQNSGLKTNKTTVYRQVDDLKLHGVLEEVQFGDGVMRYEIKLRDDHHHHVLCVGCGKVEDVVFKEDLHKHQKNIEKETKFKVLRHSLEFFGRCPKCESRLRRP